MVWLCVSSTAMKQVTNILGGMSGHKYSFARPRISPGETESRQAARSVARVVAITSAAGTPLSVTSAMTRAILPPPRSMKS